MATDSSNGTLTPNQLLRLVDRLVNSHRKSPINWFVGKRAGHTTSEFIRQARIAKERGELTSQIHHPWDRRPDESARQYEAFTYYRDQGADRTYVGTATDLNLAGSSVHLWKRLFQWAARVRAYDEHEEKRLRKVAERARKEMVERQARLGQRMTDMAQETLDAGVVVPESVADVVRLAEAGTRIERLARGESTENVVTANALILAHPLPAWAPDAAKQLVVESEYDNVEDQDGEGNVVITQPQPQPTGPKTEA